MRLTSLAGDRVRTLSSLRTLLGDRVRTLSSLRTLLWRARACGPARRADERESALVPVDWHAFGSGVHRMSTTANVSPGGAFVCTAEPMPPGSPVVLELATPLGRIEVHARVAWTDPRGMGVRFTRRPGIQIA
jgi:hypothetical protein